MSRSSHEWIEKLLAWYRQNRRPLPWRMRPSPYRIWISEVMLQQTQVATVIPYYDRFLKRFPSIKSLAEADLEEVLKIWEGLGYYSRARNLHYTARLLHSRSQTLPHSFEALQELPGFGLYTSAAVASIAFGKAVPVVDGNVLRLMARLWRMREDISEPATRKAMFERLKPLVLNTDPSDFNQGLMECGSLICTPRKPSCSTCPVVSECGAFAFGEVGELPVRRRRSRTPHLEVAVGVIWRNNKILIARRRPNQLLGGLWEFPGGQRRHAEPLSSTVIREIKEETGLRVRILKPYCTVRHAYSHFRITLTAFKCSSSKGKPCAKASDCIRWVSFHGIQKLPFPKANKKVIDAIIQQEGF